MLITSGRRDVAISHVSNLTPTRLKARSNGHNNLSTFQEQKKCCHNIVVRGGQTVSTSAHNKCCENVVTNTKEGLYFI